MEARKKRVLCKEIPSIWSAEHFTRNGYLSKKVCLIIMILGHQWTFFWSQTHTNILIILCWERLGSNTDHFHMVSMEAWTKARLCSSHVRLHPRIIFAWAQSTDKSVVGIPGVPVTSVLKAILEVVVQQKTNYLMLCRLPLALCIWSLFILKQTSIVTSAIWNKVV